MTWSISAAKNLIARCNQLRDAHRSEAVLRAEFQSWLRNIFPDPEDEAWANHYSEGSESHTRVGVQAGTLANRFIDNLVRSTIIEYEADLRDNRLRQHGFEQVQEYVAGVVRAGTPISQTRGILSDTVEWYVYDATLADGVQPENCTQNDVHLAPIDSLVATKASDEEAGAFAAFLKKHLAREQSRALTAANIAADIGMESLSYRRHIDALLALVSSARNSDSSAILATELWSRFVDGLERQQNGFRAEMYVDELYVAILARLLAANVLEAKASLNNDERLAEILNGNYFVSTFRLKNMVEHDYFGWTLRAEHLAELLPVAKEIQLDLYAYDFETLREEDLFGRLMAQLSRRSQRKLLGQEWTPNWLARQLAAKCLERIPQGEKPRVVDMCCGSGSILAEVIKQYLVIAPTASVADLSEVVTGFDIDPLAVMLAKTTWVFALASRLRGSTVEIAIPVYHADSLFASTPVSELPAPGSISDIAVELDGEIITLPAEFIAPEYRALFDDVVDWAYDEAQAAVKGDGEDLTEDIASVLLECLLSKHEMHPGESLKRKLASATFALAHRMAQLARANRNGIWAFILRNTYRPGLLAGQFNGLVSNPPWLAMSQLANNPYKQQLSKRSLLYGIKPSGASHLHLELATTFLIHAVDRYLAPGAAVACLLPGTIFKGHHQQKFRDAGYLTGPRQVALEINEVWNIEPGTFKVRSAAVIGVKKDAPFQVNRVVKAFTVRQGDIKDVPFVIARIGSRTAWVFGDLDVGHAQRDESAPGAVPPQGADLMPRTAVCIEILDKGGSEWRVNTPDRNSPWFFSVKDAKQLKGKNFPGFVAPQFIFRMAQSLNLLPFLCAGPFASIAIPAERAEAGGFKILSASQIRALGLRQTAIRFQHIDEAISRAQCGKPLADRIDERNKLSTQAFAKGQYLVLSGAGGEITCGACLAVDEFEDIVIDQTLYWKLVKTADEAWYRVGFLNSDALSDAIRTFNPEGEFGGRHLHTLPHRFTPPFDPEDATHRKIAELSKQVSGLVGDLIAQHSEIGNAEKTIASRRRKLRGLLRLLPEVVELEELCFTAITGHQPSQAAL